MITVTLEQLASSSQQAGWDLIYNQLSPGDLRGEFTQVAGRNLMVTGEKYNRPLQIRGSSSSEYLAFGLQLSTTCSGSFNGIETGPNKLLILPPGAEVDYHIPQDHHLISILVDLNLLVQKIKALSGDFGIKLDFSKARHIQLQQHSAEALTNHIHRFLFQAPMLRTSKAGHKLESSEDAILQLLSLTSLNLRSDRKISYNSGIRARSITVDSARDFIHSNFERPLSVPAICEAIGCSIRTLEYGFKDRYNLTPIQYLRAQRLNEARRKLLAASAHQATVGTIALSCGITHQGRFSCDYRKMFGESPSKTLQSK